MLLIDNYRLMQVTNVMLIEKNRPFLFFCLHILDRLFRPFKIEFINEKFVDIDNRFLTITFAKSGALLNLQHKRFNGKLRLHTDIIHYGTTKKSDSHSGAYLFIPDGDAQYTPMRDYDSIRIQRGPLVTRVIINHKLYGLQYKLTNTNGLLKIDLMLHQIG